MDIKQFKNMLMRFEIEHHERERFSKTCYRIKINNDFYSYYISMDRKDNVNCENTDIYANVINYLSRKYSIRFNAIEQIIILNYIYKLYMQVDKRFKNSLMCSYVRGKIFL